MGAITLGQAIVAAGDPDVDASVEPLVVVPMQPLFVPLERAFAVYWAADVVTGRARVGGVELKAVGAGDVQMASSASRSDKREQKELSDGREENVLGVRSAGSWSWPPVDGLEGRRCPGLRP